MAHVKDYLSPRSQRGPKAFSHDSANGQNAAQPLPTPWGSLHERQKKQPVHESPQVLTYHQIPLLALDWNTDKAHQWGAAGMGDNWTERVNMTVSKASQENIEDPPSANDMWGTFHNGTDDRSVPLHTSVYFSVAFCAHKFINKA